MNEEMTQKEAKFIFESETTPTEYGNMTTHFPSFYWQYAKLGTFLAISLISVIGVISNQSRSELFFKKTSVPRKGWNLSVKNASTVLTNLKVVT